MSLDPPLEEQLEKAQLRNEFLLGMLLRFNRRSNAGYCCCDVATGNPNMKGQHSELCLDFAHLLKTGEERKIQVWEVIDSTINQIAYLRIEKLVDKANSLNWIVNEKKMSYIDYNKLSIETRSYMMAWRLQDMIKNVMNQ